MLVRWRRGWFAAVALLALGLGLPGCDKRQAPLPRLAADDVVLAFGDSLTYGTGARTAQESYPEVLAQLIGHPVVRDGVAGEVSAQALERLPRSLDAYQPKLVVLCVGGNDMLRQLDPAATEANLRAMIELARSRAVSVVLIGVPKPTLIGGTAEFYRRVADELKVPLEAEVLSEVLRDNASKSDPVHPNAQGYRRMAQAVAELLRASGAI